MIINEPSCTDDIVNARWSLDITMVIRNHLGLWASVFTVYVMFQPSRAKFHIPSILEQAENAKCICLYLRESVGRFDRIVTAFVLP